MLVYLCGAIDQCENDSEMKDWRERAKVHLSICKFNVYDAVTAFKFSNYRQNYCAVYEINKVALSQSDVVLAHIPKIFTVGTFVELQMAKEINIPVYAFVSQELKNSIILSALLYGKKVFTRFDDALTTLVDDNLGEAGLSDE